MSTEATPGSPDTPSNKDTAPTSSDSSGEGLARASAFASTTSDERRAEHREAAAAAEAAAGLGPVGAGIHHDDLIAALRREHADLKDKNLRLLADMENLRRRTEDEKTSSARYAITRFATDIVNIGDNFQRAIAAVPADAADPALKSLLEGVEMTEREYLNVLERHGVKRIVSKGELFNPHLHQPMMQVPNPSVPSGTILQVFQDGYMIGDRLLRAAVVTVAEGGPKPVKPTEPLSSATTEPTATSGDGSGPAS